MSYKFVIPLLLLFSIVSLASAQGSTISATNYSAAYANQTITQTLSYVNQVNQSAYLIFYPDLSKAYSYIGQAQKVYLSSPSSAVSYANQAYLIAQSQYLQIGTYRLASLAVMLILTAAFLTWIYFLMKPMKSPTERRYGKKANTSRK
ncbi:MAG: hypothetical protein KGH71_05410 [Candidatus Micrarchaeota archaeon]|nr:hypothetical protein [Candidatus Micrarchaeota archaeon]